MPWGTSRAVSTSPATTSWGNQARSYVRATAIPGTNREIPSAPSGAGTYGLTCDELEAPGTASRGLGVQEAPGLPVALPVLVADGGVVEVEGLDRVHEDGDGERLHDVLVVRRHDVPRRPLRGGGGDGVLVGGHVLVPECPLGDVGGVELPQLVRVVEPGHEPPLLLRLRHVEEELHDLGAVAVEMPLPGVQIVVARLPEGGTAVAVRKALLGEPLGV